MRRTSAGVSTIARLGACLVLLAGLIALPLAVVTIIGTPDRDVLSDAFGTGRVDDAAIVQIGLVVFLLLWAWFASTAIGEIVRVASWRGGRQRRALAPVATSPSGWIRRAVRLAMLGSTSLVGTGLLVSGAGPGVVRAQAAAISPSDVDASAPAAREPAGIVSTGRDTPYSIAVRLGDPSLRERIIDLNRGTTLPDGSTWTSGVFPEGMPIAVPTGSLAPPAHPWVTYTVVEGDSVYRIAARIAPDSGRVRDLADEIIHRNIGKLMNDGTLFEDPSLIRIGWQIEIPDLTRTEPSTASAGHVVEPGESYWSIAEDRLESLGEPVTGPAVAALTDDLIRLNDPLLGHDIETLVVP
ncbi:MAG: LysM peptidoglycan-binding domain-containing protein, partial [Actinobacteria bacterium]|nr:LysM peptidoglycan-binding domain-containing protein [Actinomycetota bacterium]